MQGIEVPELTEDFTADPVELFFDLGYVFAFSQLVGHLIHHPDWTGVGEAGLLFILMWMAWSQFTWSANAVSGNGRPVRLIFLVATAISVAMAASVSTAFGAGGLVFGLGLAAIYLLALATMALSLDRGSDVFASMIRYATPTLIAIGLILLGSFLDDGVRVALWIASLAVIGWAVLAAGGGEWIVRPGHFAERHGLIIIIALGEVIVAIGIPVVASLEAGGIPGDTLVALVGSGIFAGLLWWAYFDRAAPAVEHRATQIEGGAAPGRFVRDVYTGAHAPIVAGIIVAAAALEEIALHPGDAVPTAFRLMLAGGLAMSIFGVSAAVWRSYHVVAWERVAAAAAIAALAVLASSMAGTTLLILVDGILVVMLLVEHQRIEGGAAEPAETAAT